MLEFTCDMCLNIGGYIMALIKCPECGKEISDKARACIHCGFPIELQGKQSEKADVTSIVNEADQLRKSTRYTEAIALYEKAAALDDAHSQLWLGNFYERGLGVAIDYTKAHYWFEKAANQNNTDAINNLGRLYAKGQGVPKNIVKANELYKKASDLGNAIASGNLATVYYFGNDVSVDYKLAVHYYTLALNQGSKEYAVMNNLGVCYMDGKGTPQNLPKAEELLKKAISLGSKSAKDNLAILHTHTAQNTQAKPITQNKTSSVNTQNVSKKSGGFGIFIAILVILGLLLIGIVSGDDDRGDRTCPWCNGTGYNGNGAQTVEEYVFSKTPCTHCDGKGSY